MKLNRAVEAQDGVLKKIPILRGSGRDPICCADTTRDLLPLNELRPDKAQGNERGGHENECRRHQNRAASQSVIERTCVQVPQPAKLGESILEEGLTAHRDLVISAVCLREPLLLVQ